MALFKSLLMGHLLTMVALLVAGEYSPANFIDDGKQSVSQIFKDLCHRPGARISRLTSILSLEEHVKSMTKEADDLDRRSDLACMDKYSRPLELMAELINIGKSKGVCSFIHISALTDYHYRYLASYLPTRWSSWTTSSKRSDELADPLRDFFARYALQVAQVCGDNMEANLQAAMGTEKVDMSSLFAEDIQSQLLVGMRNLLYSGADIKNRGDFLLFWQALVDMMRRKGKISSDEFIDEAGDTEYAMFKLKQIGALVAKQEVCRFSLRPIYQSTVLPVMRLLDLGYQAEERPMTDLLREWYTITQFCEFLLPIGFYEDPELSPKKAVILNQKEETLGLKGPEKHESRRLIGSSSAVKPINLDDEIIANMTSTKILKMVKHTSDSRNKVVKTMIKGITKSAKSLLKQSVGRIFVSRKTKDGRIVQDQVSEKQLIVGEKLIDEDTGVPRVRNKRELYYDSYQEETPYSSHHSKRVGGFFHGLYKFLKICVLIYIVVILSLILLSYAG